MTVRRLSFPSNDQLPGAGSDPVPGSVLVQVRFLMLIKPPAGAGAPAGEEGRCSRPVGREQREEGGIYLPKWKSPFFS